MSDFWKKKMRTYFKRIDYDRDGSITQKDFQGMATRFISEGKFDAAKGKDLEDTLTKVWQSLDAAGSGGVQVEPFIAAMQAAVNDDAKFASLTKSLEHFFHAVDSNNDNQIDNEEYKKFFAIMNVDTGLADGAFKSIDTNNDGMLSVEEFVAAGTDFFKVQDDSSPNKFFWGALED